MADDDADFAEFQRKLAEEQKQGVKGRLQDAPPIGAGPDGTVTAYKSLDDIPPYEPEIIYADGDDDLSDLDELDELGDV